MSEAFDPETPVAAQPYQPGLATNAIVYALHELAREVRQDIEDLWDELTPEEQQQILEADKLMDDMLPWIEAHEAHLAGA